MKSLPSPFELGATLYMPATRTDIFDVIQRKKIKDLRSLVICLEDAVAEKDVPMALSHVRDILAHLHDSERSVNKPLLFIRPRHPDMGKTAC